MIDKVNLKGTNHYIEDTYEGSLRNADVKVKRIDDFYAKVDDSLVHLYDILFFHTGQFNINSQGMASDTNKYAAIRMDKNYYYAMYSAYVRRYIQTPNDWYYGDEYGGWYLMDTPNDDGYMVVSSSYDPQGTSYNYLCTISQDYYLEWSSSIELVEDTQHRWHLSYDHLISPQRCMVLSQVDKSIDVSGISKQNYTTDPETPLHFTFDHASDNIEWYGVFGACMLVSSIEWKIPAGTTFRANNSISTIKPKDLIKGIEYLIVPNPVDVLNLPVSSNS